MVLTLDHGASDGFIPGMTAIPELLRSLNGCDVNGVVLNKGWAREASGLLQPWANLVVQLSAGTKHGLPTYNKSIVCSAQEALRIGADAVAVHANIANDLEDRMLADLGAITDEARQLGLPVLAVLYARGPQIVNEPPARSRCWSRGGQSRSISTAFSACSARPWTAAPEEPASGATSSSDPSPSLPCNACFSSCTR